MSNFGEIYYLQGDYENALQYIEKGLRMKKKYEVRNWQIKFEMSIIQCISRKRLGIEYEEEVVLEIMKNNESVYPAHFYNLYLLFESKSYLEQAYKLVNQIDFKILE